MDGIQTKSGTAETACGVPARYTISVPHLPADQQTNTIAAL
jgi:hypothetical protein